MYKPKRRLRERGRGGGTVAIVTDPEDKIYLISFLNRLWLNENTSDPLGMNRGGREKVVS